METKKVFRPVYGLDANIISKEYNEGFVYFATDSGKIYLDTTENGVAKNKMAMGGSGASLFYTYDETVIQKPGDIHILTFSIIDGSDNLKKDDLIINQANGCFYKVNNVSIETDEVECSLIAVSGTGGSSGGGTGGDTETNLTVTISGITTRSTFVYGQQALINMNIKAEYDAYANVVFEIIGRTDSKIITKEDIPANGTDQSLDIGSLLYEGLNDVIIWTETNNSGSVTYKYTNCQAVRMSLTGAADINPAKIFTEATTINVIPIGQGLSKYITLKIDGIDIPDSGKMVVQSGSAEGIYLPMQEHGFHTVEIGMYAVVNGQKIPVPSLNYEFAWKEENNSTPIIWLGNYKKTLTNYKINSVEYMVYDPEIGENVEFTIDLIKETTASQRTIAYNSTNMLIWNISDYSIGRNNYAISYKGQARNITFDVLEDTSRPNMIINPTGLDLNLDSQGRSNGEPSYKRNVWEYERSNGTTLKTTFNNFNWYNNGWIEDEKGISALRIANGSSISIQTTGVMQSEELRSGWTFEFRFKVRNVQSYKTLVNITGEADSEKTNSELIPNFKDYSFASLYGNSVGLGLGPSDIFFRGGGQIASVRYKENEMVNASIVIENYIKNDGTTNKIIYIYINGIMSKVVECNQDKGFLIDSLALEFNSNVCDVDLYNVRIYNRALSFSEIVQNYVVDEKNIQLYDVNNITTTTAEGVNTIDLASLNTYNNDHKDNPTMPYAILKVNDSSATNDFLPYKKGNKIKCDVTFINVPLDTAYETNTLQPPRGMDIKEFYKHSCPSFKITQAEVDVQGTSSQGYPRRNYKLKFKNGKDWVMHQGPYKENPESLSKIYLDNSRGENKVTWKADYMESSGTHNTGFTSYVKTLYSKHPLEDYYDKDTIENLEDFRTTIYGFPMMVFQEHKDGTFEFIGKYNFNYDKDCPNVIGFTYSEQHPILTDKKMSEVAECWELCNNKGTRCSFTKVDFDEVTNAENDLTLTVLDDFEYRYLDTNKAEYLDEYTDKAIPINEEANTKVLNIYKNLEEICTWLYNLDTSNAALKDFETDEEKKLEKERRLNIFEKDFQKHFDLEYCLVYFILNELLIQYDSRGKNMMLASWGPQTEGGNYIWYPIFYDVDTQLGINNSGVPLWDYDVNPSDDDIFSTANSVLWKNFYQCFLTQIKSKYADLRDGRGSGILDFEHLNGYYDFNPNISNSYAMKGLRPEVVYNADSYFKYIAPDRTGFINTQGIIEKSSAYYYCAQGTRELQRELFLNNRFYYLDSKWQGGSFSNASKGALVQTRINANVTTDTSDQAINNDNYPNEFDVPNNMMITPYLNSYAGVYIDDTPSFSKTMVKAGERNEINFQSDFVKELKETPNKTQQLVYICGKEYISDFGDLSRYYFNEMNLSGAIRLKKLKLGSDLEGYYNNFFFPSQMIVFDTENGYPLLQSLNFSKLNKFNGNLDFLHKSEKLKELRALGSSITGVQFADGAQIEVCHLPKTITNLSLIETNNLTSLLQDKNALQEDIDGNKEWVKGLYIEGLTDYLTEEQINETAIDDLANQLISITIIGSSLGINSYRLLNALIKIKEKIYASENDYPKGLSIHMTNINWSPYIQIEAGAKRNVDTAYYLKQDNYTFKTYTYSSEEQWNLDTLNGKVYRLDNNFDTSYITDLSMLDTLIDNIGDRYHDSTASSGTIPYLSGVLYVNGTVDELSIRNRYNVYFPALEIQVKEVVPAYTVKYVEVKDTGEEYTWEVQKYENKNYSEDTTKVTALKEQPTRTHYDFLGWSLSADSTTPDDKQPTDYSLDDITKMAVNNIVTFYAVYKKHEYELLFYNYDGTSLDGNSNINDENYIGKIKVEYEQNLQVPNIVPYADDSDLAVEYTYSFVGYSEYGKVDNPTNPSGLLSLKEIESQTSLKDRKFYARYEQKNVKDNIHPEYFTSYNVDYTDIYNNDYSLHGGVGLKLNTVIKGKLTIPTKYNGKPVLELNNSFSASQNGNYLTHIFFQKDTQIKRFQISGNIGTFQNNTNLQYIEIPDSLRYICNNCFRGCSNLTLSNNYLGDNLAYIGSFAFTGALKKNSLADAESILTISEKIEELEYYSFGNPNTSIALLTIGSKEKPANFLNLSRTTSNQGDTFIFSASGEKDFMNIILYTDNYSQADLENYYKKTGGTINLQVIGGKADQEV